MRLRAPPWVLLPLFVLALAVLAGLGTWQLRRYFEKQEIEAAYDARTSAAPLSLAQVSALAPEERDYHRVALDGTWDSAHAIRVSNLYRSGIRGEEYVVPLRASDGRAVLVNRGWYPLEERERVTAQLAAEAGGTIEGLAHHEPSGRARRLEDGSYTRFEPAALALAVPYPVEPWGVLEGGPEEPDAAVPGQPLPVRGWTPFENRIPHLEYALTWWGLGLALIVTVAVRFGRARYRALDREPKPDASRAL